jgi:hypothetical protein
VIACFCVAPTDMHELSMVPSLAESTMGISVGATTTGHLKRETNSPSKASSLSHPTSARRVIRILEGASA